MATSLFTYSLIRTLHELGQDYIDSFWPLVLNVLPKDKKGLPLAVIQKNISSQYGIFIPEYSLGTIIKRATRKKLTERRESLIHLTDEGVVFAKNKLEPEQEAKRRVNEFVEDARSFMHTEHRLDLSYEEILSVTQRFIVQNLETFESFLNPEAKSELQQNTVSSDADSAILHYFKFVETSRPQIFRTLQDIVSGSIISATVYNPELLREIGRRFEHSSVYLDSNYLFSLLGLAFEEDNKPARELFDLMKSIDGFDFLVFDFTLLEMTSVLRSYERQQHRYTTQVRVKGDLFSSLKSQGWTSARVREFVADLEDRLWKDLGIRIASTDVDLKSHAIDAARRDKLNEYKPGQGLLGQNHDLAAIDQIRALRKKPIRRIEKCQAIFLTSDLKLALFNYSEEHQDYTVSEVIPDRVLTNILWLKNPEANKALPLDSIISLHSRQLFVDPEVWQRFYATLATLKAQGTIDEQAISHILYGGQIEEVLRSTEADSESIETDLMRILGDIERKREEPLRPPPGLGAGGTATAAQPVQSVEVSSQEEGQVKKQVAALNAKLGGLESEKNDILFDVAARLKKLAEIEAEEFAISATNLLSIAAVVGIVGASLPLIKMVVELWSRIEPVAWIISILASIVLGLLGYKFQVPNFKLRVRNGIFNYNYRRKLRRLVMAGILRLGTSDDIIEVSTKNNVYVRLDEG